jgi:hypothetical protein
MGRTLTDDDDKTEGDHPVAVISYAWWTRSLARDKGVLNWTIKLGSTTFDIVSPRVLSGLSNFRRLLPLTGA